jgi:hypothetical protein
MVGCADSGADYAQGVEMSARQTQCDRILFLLQAAEGRWVGLFRIMQLHIASHTRRIHELRKDGHVIEMQSHFIGRQRLVEYRLVEKLSAEK